LDICPSQNHILARLPKDECSHLLTHLKLIELKPGDILVQPDTLSHYVHFPVSGTVALYSPLDHGMSSQIALIGNEGMFSIVPVLGGELLPYLAQVETAGHAYRLETRILKKELEHSRTLRHTMLLYVQALFMQIIQVSLCARHNSVRQLLCLHLLLVHDRVQRDSFLLTQQALAHMLGVRRESVTQVSGALRKDGYIDYKRGVITILDRKKLEHECLDCYAAIKPSFQKLMRNI
jgi:CRP-like cAMP-binding protein